jgi:DNA-directed RNA polymerase alpha subunit
LPETNTQVFIFLSKLEAVLSGKRLTKKQIEAIFTDLTGLVEEMGGSPEDLQRLVQPEGRDVLKAMAYAVAAASPQAFAMRLPIEGLSLNMRVYNSLKRVGVGTAFDLVVKSEEELRRLIPYFRDEDIGHIRGGLAQYGLSLRKEEA